MVTEIFKLLLRHERFKTCCERSAEAILYENCEKIYSNFIEQN